MNIRSIILHSFNVRRQRIFSIDNPTSVIGVKAKMNIRISKVTPDNVAQVTDFRSENQVASFRKFLAEGQYGIYALLDGKVVGHGWAKVCTQPHCIVNGYIDIYKGEAFIHYCNVSEKHRGQNIYPFMLTMLCRRLFEEAQIKRVIIDTEVDNKASLSGIAKVGFKPRGNGTYLQFRRWRILKHVTNHTKTPSLNSHAEKT